MQLRERIRTGGKERKMSAEASWYCACRRRHLLNLFSTARKEQVNELIIQMNQVFANNIKGRTNFRRNNDQDILHFANAAARLQFEMAIAVGVFIGVRLLLL